MPVKKQIEEYSHSADTELEDLRRELAEAMKKNTEKDGVISELQERIGILSGRKEKSRGLDENINSLQQYVETLKSSVTQLEQLYENTDQYENQIWKVVTDILNVKAEVKNIEIINDNQEVKQYLRNLHNFIDKGCKHMHINEIAKISNDVGDAVGIPLGIGGGILSGYSIYNWISIYDWIPLKPFTAFLGGCITSLTSLYLAGDGTEYFSKYFLKRSRKQKIYDILERSEHALGYLKGMY
jgi:chaperonin cofactor prefoldin